MYGVYRGTQKRTIAGLLIIRGMKWNGEEWSGGTIVDPENGVKYKAKIWLDPNNSTRLKVRVYYGIFYRTQTWKRKAWFFSQNVC